MKPKTTSPTYNRALGHQQFNYPNSSGQPVTSSIKTNPLLTASSLISALPSAVATSLQGSQQATVDYSHLLTAQEILAKQASISLPCTQNVASSLDSTLALAASKANSGNLEYLTKLYLQASAAKKSTDFTSSLDLLNTEKLLSQLSPSSTNLQSGAAVPGTHYHNGLDYRLCPCVSCQTLRLSVLTAQQQLNVNSKPSVTASTSNVTTTQQHFLLPHKNPLTGSLQYLPVCPDPSNCSLCLQLSQNNTNLTSLSATAGQALKSNCAALTTEQYLTALASQSAAVNKSSTSPSPTVEKRQFNEFLAPLQINTSPSPTIEKANDITCSWTESGLPCGQKFLSEDQLFDHIKKAHTSNNNSNRQNNSPPQLISFEEELQKLHANPLTSLSNLSKKVLPTSTTSSARFHPYTRPSLPVGGDSSQLNSSTNHITSNSSRPSALPLLSSSFVGSHNPLSTLSALTLPNTAGTNLPFSISTSSTNSQLLSNTQMSNLLFAAAAR